MRRIAKKILVSLLMATTVIGGLKLGLCNVKAEETTVEETTAQGDSSEESSSGEQGTSKIYFYNDQGWDKVCVWLWDNETTNQLGKSAWPGDEMTEVGDGWYIYEFAPTKDYKLLFTNGESSQTVQSADSDVLNSGKTYWIKVGSGEVKKNDSGTGAGKGLEIYTETQAGWPEGPAAEATEATTEDSKKTSSSKTDDSKKDGSNLTPIIIVVVVVLAAAAVGAVVCKKKKN